MKISMLGMLLALLVPTGALACSCRVSTLEDNANDADEIYFATLQQATLILGEYGKQWPSIEGRFQVRKTLKGSAPAGLLNLGTPTSDASCGVTMAVAETYLIFKKKNQNSIVACDGSTIIESFQEDEVAEKIRALMSKNAGSLPKK